MTRHPTATDVAEHALNGELKPHLSDAIQSRDDPIIRCLGIDSEDRVVFYSVDSGRVLRYEYVPEDHELDRDVTTFIGRSLDENDPEDAFIYLTARGVDWTWIHPRFRWAHAELDAMEQANEQMA